MVGSSYVDIVALSGFTDEPPSIWLRGVDGVSSFALYSWSQGMHLLRGSSNLHFPFWLAICKSFAVNYLLKLTKINFSPSILQFTL
jgi:hypothetical protein